MPMCMDNEDALAREEVETGSYVLPGLRGQAMPALENDTHIYYALHCPLCCTLIGTSASDGRSNIGMSHVHKCIDGVYQISLQMTFVAP